MLATLLHILFAFFVLAGVVYFPIFHWLALHDDHRSDRQSKNITGAVAAH